MEFDLNGPLRVELRSDGYYVVGQGIMMAVDTFDEGQQFINHNKNWKNKMKHQPLTQEEIIKASMLF